MSELDAVEILKMFHDKINPSTTELAEATGLSLSTVHGILLELEREGMIEPPRAPNVPRDRRITEKGETYLQVSGFIKTEVFENESYYGDQIVRPDDKS